MIVSNESATEVSQIEVPHKKSVGLVWYQILVWKKAKKFDRNAKPHWLEWNKYLVYVRVPIGEQANPV